MQEQRPRQKTKNVGSMSLLTSHVVWEKRWTRMLAWITARSFCVHAHTRRLAPPCTEDLLPALLLRNCIYLDICAITGTRVLVDEGPAPFSDSSCLLCFHHRVPRDPEEQLAGRPAVYDCDTCGGIAGGLVHALLSAGGQHRGLSCSFCPRLLCVVQN